jgi:hypothetical protein
VKQLAKPPVAGILGENSLKVFAGEASLVAFIDVAPGPLEQRPVPHHRIRFLDLSASLNASLAAS